MIPERHTPLARAAIALAALALLTFTFVAGQARADTKDEIEETKRQIDVLVERIAAQAGEIQGLQSDANDLAARINSVLSEIARTEARIHELEAEIERAERRLRALRGRLDQRAREIYENGAGTEIELLLGATTFEDFTARLEFVNRAAETDRDLFDQVRNRQNELRHKKRTLGEQQARLGDRHDALRGQQQELQNSLRASQNALDQLEADQAEAERLLGRLENERARELEAARLAAAAADQSADQMGGSGPGPFFVCPVDHPRAYSNDWGAPRPGGRTHQGNDIFAPLGTPVRATFPGNAVVTTNDLGGLAVSVYGSAGFAYNAHLSAFGSLGSVETGTIIGYVGATGNAQGTSPHNHFEWHPGGGAAVNPFFYLNEVC